MLGGIDTVKKFIEMSLKDLALQYGVSGLEVSKITYNGTEMPVFGSASPAERKMIQGGKIRYTIRDRFAFNASDEECQKESEYPLYFYSDWPMNLKWRVDVGTILYPCSGQPIKVIP